MAWLDLTIAWHGMGRPMPGMRSTKGSYWSTSPGSSWCLMMPVRSHSLSITGTPSFLSLDTAALSAAAPTQYRS